MAIRKRFHLPIGVSEPRAYLIVHGLDVAEHVTQIIDFLAEALKSVHIKVDSVHPKHHDVLVHTGNTRYTQYTVWEGIGCYTLRYRNFYDS